MGPGSESIPRGSLLSPPALEPEIADAVAWWPQGLVDEHHRFHWGGSYKIQRYRYVYGFYRLSFTISEFEGQVKEYIHRGEIVVEISGERNAYEQLQTLEKIIPIIAKRTTVDRVTRIVRVNTKYHKWIRKEGKLIKKYINRLQKPALAYPNITAIEKGIQIAKKSQGTWYRTKNVLRKHYKTWSVKLLTVLEQRNATATLVNT